ncbi:MAG: carboxypeptidase regulatory-like domain-containing protein [Planctomycetaceae bacterium]|nr:carboxypeptidase regulatory-like domain-containing protein [Planctomycetaceae bacterium]
MRWSLLLAGCTLILLCAAAVAQDESNPAVKHVPEFPRVLEGQIVDDQKQPIAGAVLKWGPRYPWNRKKLIEAQTDDNGEFRIETDYVGSQFSLQISAKGCCSTWGHNIVPGPKSNPTEMNISLAKDNPLTIHAVNENGRPAPGLTVVPLTPSNGVFSSFSSPTTPEQIPGHDEPVVTDENGVCRLEQLIPGPEPLQSIEQEEQRAKFNNAGWLRLNFMRDEDVVHYHQISRIEYHASHGDVTVVIPNRTLEYADDASVSTLHLQVIDTDGNPVPNYQATLRHRAQTWPVNNPEGRLAIENLRASYRCQIRAFAVGYAPHSEYGVANQTSENNPVVITLQPHEPLRVRLVDAKTRAPVANVNVLTGVFRQRQRNYIEWSSFDEYADGHHSLEDVCRHTSDANGMLHVPEGIHPASLVIYHRGFSRRVILPVNRPEPDSDGVIEIPLQREAVIRGRIPEGSQFRELTDSISLSFQSNDGVDHMYERVDLDDKGEFEIHSLEGGSYHVTLMHSEGNVTYSCWSRKFEIEPGAATELEPGKLTGNFVFAGRTEPFTRVALTPTHHVEVSHLAVVSDVDGYFRIEGLQRGQFKAAMGVDSLNGRILRMNPKVPAVIDLNGDQFIDYRAEEGETLPFFLSN